jgi:TatD DNase family protein
LTCRVIDSHCHLDYEGLAERLPEVLRSAESAGVGLMVSIGTQVRKFPNLLKVADENANVFCTVGTHPHHAHEELDVTVEDLTGLAQHPRVVGIGECGLDYHYDFSPRAAQEQGFRTHIKAARAADLPLVIHAREADEDVARIMAEEAPCKYLLHCFTGSPALAARGLALGAYISFSGILTYKSAENLKAIAKDVPMDRLLVETDAPYLAPVPHRGKGNEPAFVVETLKTLAAIKGLAPEEMARVTSSNFFRLFSKVPKPKDWPA